MGLYGPERQHYRQELLRWLQARLDPARFGVVCALYGLSEAGPMNYRDTAAKLGLSVMAVKRRRREAIDALRQFPEFADMLRFAAADLQQLGKPHPTSSGW